MTTTATHRDTRAATAIRPSEAADSGGNHPRTGWGLTGFVAIFLLFDGGARLAGFAPYVDGLVRFGYDAALAPWIGATLLVSTILYLLPRTAVLGAILLAGYLGGAAASQARMMDPWFLFPVVLAAAAWAGLWAREPRLRALLPLRK